MPKSSPPYPYPSSWDPEAENYLSDDDPNADQILLDQITKGANGSSSLIGPGSFPDIVFVSGLPKVLDGEKKQKLTDFMRKKFDEEKRWKNFGIDMPLKQDGSGETGGCAWLKFSSRKEAEKARNKIHGIKLGGKPVSAILFDDYQQIMECEEKFDVKSAMPAQQASIADTRNWLQDPKCREQLLLRFQQQTEIHWIDSLKVLEPYYCGEREKSKNKVWCDWKVGWSTYGSYLVTCHRPGVCLWGGESMSQKRKFMHAEVNFFTFSPDESYLVTWNGQWGGNQGGGNQGDPNSTSQQKAYKLWDVKTGRCLMEKPCPLYSPSGEIGSFPHFIFSPDSRFFARCTEKEIIVHTLPSCSTYMVPNNISGGGPGAAAAAAAAAVGNGSIRFENGVGHFSFSPKENVIGVWSPQQSDTPSCLSVLNVETGERLQTRSRPNFNAELKWHSEGDYLCVLLSRRGKVGKDGREQAPSKCKTLDILRMREKNIPVETVDIEKDIGVSGGGNNAGGASSQPGVKTFAWEPKANRFAILTDHKDSPNKTMLLFYSLSNKDKCELIQSFELQSGNYNEIYWSPDGQYLVIASVNNGGAGDLLWCRLLPLDNTLELLQKDEQVSLTHVEWDGSGRYLLTSVLQQIDADPKHNIGIGQDAGFRLWTFQGRPLHLESIEKLYHASFRPNPPSLLSIEQQKDIRKNLKSHSRRFEQADDEARNRQRREEREAREITIKEFIGICATLNNNYHQYAQHCGWITDNIDERHKFREVIETVEELVSCTEDFITYPN